MSPLRRYFCCVDLNERGIYRASVRDESDKVIFSISNEEDSEEGELWLVRDGFMKNYKDMEGLSDYLSSHGLIESNAVIVWRG